MADRLIAQTHILDPTQTLTECQETAELLEDHCARICPDGTFASAQRYDHVYLHALRN